MAPDAVIQSPSTCRHEPHSPPKFALAHPTATRLPNGSSLGVVESRHELTLLDDDFADREPALARLASAAVSGQLPAGPELRQRQPLRFEVSPGVVVNATLSVAEMGFSPHAATTPSADDARGREALVRYALRPPIALAIVLGQS